MGYKRGCNPNSHKSTEESRKKLSSSVQRSWEGRKVPRETRSCACGCGGTFESKMKSKQRYLHNHHLQGKRQSSETIAKRALKKTMPRETRVCMCGCGESFTCKVNSSRRFILGHNSNGDGNPSKNPEVLIKISQKAKTRELERKGLKIGWHSDEALQKKLCNARPNKIERKVLMYLNKVNPGMFEYIGDAAVIINHRTADFLSEELKMVVLAHGYYWHLKKFGLAVTEENKRAVEKIDAIPFVAAGYKVMFIWDDEIDKLLMKVNQLP